SRHTVEGTSYAAAIVTGAAAKIWASYPDLTADEVRTILLNSTAVVDEWKVFDLEEALAWKPENVAVTFEYLDVGDCMEMAIRWAMDKISLFLKNVSLE
ncbi:MAG: S8 family serine peptidase, partial [Firmicutes bacterium]|nr:S8 family serine peptidase [Bacillota bacterium]